MNYIDIKKPGRIAGIGHRIIEDRTGKSNARAQERRQGLGIHACEPARNQRLGQRQSKRRCLLYRWEPLRQRSSIRHIHHGQNLAKGQMDGPLVLDRAKNGGIRAIWASDNRYMSVIGAPPACRQ
ncbi:MAG: hypothetical protein WCS20_01920 [Alphaproteobacteria bacterium]